MDIMPAEAETLNAALYLVSFVAMSSIGIPQTIALLRRGRSGDGLNLFRVLWVLLMGAFCLLLMSRAIVWVDLAVFDQAWLGPIAVRWPWEIGVSFVVTAASIYAASLYWLTRKEARP